MKRIGEPDEVAAMATYLASDEARFVTGCEFRIDGGLTALTRGVEGSMAFVALGDVFELEIRIW